MGVADRDGSARLFPQTRKYLNGWGIYQATEVHGFLSRPSPNLCIYPDLVSGQWKGRLRSAMAREYDHLFKLLIIGDSGKLRCKGLSAVNEMCCSVDELFFSPAACADYLDSVSVLLIQVEVTWEHRNTQCAGVLRIVWKASPDIQALVCAN